MLHPTSMDPKSTLARFDSEMRADPPEEARTRVERSDRVVRLVGDHCTILYSQLDAASAPEVIREQTSFFRSVRREVEWKVYGHDLPANLGEMLRSAGYVPDPPETLLAFDLSQPLARPADVEIRRVVDGVGLSEASIVSRDAFSPGRGWEAREFADRLSDPSLAIVVAYAEGRPVASGRLEMPEGRSFASLWGGGTVPSYRGRGVFRSVVAARAEIARGRGYPFLFVEALPTSRPILERIGFVPLTTVTGWVLSPHDDPASPLV